MSGELAAVGACQRGDIVRTTDGHEGYCVHDLAGKSVIQPLRDGARAGLDRNGRWVDPSTLVTVVRTAASMRVAITDGREVDPLKGGTP